MTQEKNEKWEEYKKSIYDNILKGAGKDKADAFMKHYSQRYDSIKKPLLDWKLAYKLLDDYHYCKRVGTRWFAFVGTGGTGKSTLLKNVFYWLDDRFQPEDLTLESATFIRKLGETERFDTMRALAMDEPDDDIHPQTEIGKLFRKVLGKARQGRYFFGVCATDLNDIPPYIFRKIDVIIFTPSIGKFMMFKNKPRERSYVVQEIRKNYQDRGYKVFFESRSDVGCLTGYTLKDTPWSGVQERTYLKTKKKDFEENIQQAVKLIDDKNKPPRQKDKDEVAVLLQHMNSKGGLSGREIAKLTGKSKDTIYRYLKAGNVVSPAHKVEHIISREFKKKNLSKKKTGAE